MFSKIFNKIFGKRKKTYICGICWGKFERVKGDKEANKEAEKMWGVKNASERKDFVIICDDCFIKIHPSKHPHKYENTMNTLHLKLGA